MNSERKAFNQWVLTHSDNLDLTSYEENIMFDAWKASAQRQGYKLVPVEVLERTIGHISIAMCHPNNTRNEEDIMNNDMVIIEKAMIGAVDE